MPYEFYKLLHISGLILMFSGQCALLGAFASGNLPQKSWRISLAIVHGLGMLFLLVSGFGMLARLGLVNGLPTWAIAKLTIWLVMGATLALAKRRSQLKMILVLIWAMLGVAAAFIAIYKPF